MSESGINLIVWRGLHLFERKELFSIEVETWLILSGTIRSKQNHESTMV